LRTESSLPQRASDTHRRVAGADGLERFPIRWNHLIGKGSLKFKELEHALAQTPTLLAETHLLGEIGARLGVIWGDHRIIGR